MRIKVVIAFFFFVWLSLLFRVYYLSIQSNTYYDELANRNTIKTKYIVPVRGEILDRNQKPLAINRVGFRIKLSPHLSHEKMQPTLNELVDVIAHYIPRLSRDKLYETYVKNDSHYNHNFIEIVEFIAYEDILPVYSRLSLYDHVRLEPSPQRHYPYGDLAAHVLGYVSRANQSEFDEDPVIKMTGSVGKSGVEKFYNYYLQGEAGYRQIQVSAYNEEIEELKQVEPKENRNLVLTMDIDLQQYIKKIFADKTGVAIVMDINGGLLAAISLPEYDLNTFVTGISTQKWQELITDIDAPFTNKIINGLFPPGSVIKTGMGLIYTTEGEISPSKHFECSGTMELGKRNFRCWKSTGHDQTNLIKAIRESCDDYFYKGSLKVGISAMSSNLMRYGLGKKTGIDLPNEFIGTIPNKEWKRQKYNQSWYIGETLNSSIGQGDMLVTPIQMAQFTALMATGKLPVPHLAYQVGDELYEPEPVDVLTEAEKKKLPLIKKAMREVCHDPMGTATNFISTKVPIAGKTGTAQVVGISQETKKRLKEHELAYLQRSHAWLSTYGPYHNPQYIVSILVEHGGHGGYAAGPIVSKIFDWLMANKYIVK